MGRRWKPIVGRPVREEWRRKALLGGGKGKKGMKRTVGGAFAQE